MEPKWCVVANVVGARLHGEAGELRHGTKHFTPGTKVYVRDAFWGMGGESVTVVGRARHDKRWITVTLRAEVLENWRATVVYEPAVLERMADDAVQGDETTAREWAESLSRHREAARVRLVQATVEGCRDAAATAAAAGVPVLTAPVRGVTGRPEWTESAFVLVADLRPVAGLVYTQVSDRWAYWLEVWIDASRPDTLAELVARAGRRAPCLDNDGLDRLIADLRSRRSEADGAP
jgi:hypothetical protein